MSTTSKIEWTEATWNPVTGCTKVSAGCTNCYACTMAKRLKAMGNPRYTNGFDVTLHEDLIGLPLTWKKPKRIFVNSMSDLFHEDVPIEFIEKIFETMNRAHWHIFQILTKRAERLTEIAPQLNWTSNIWQGVTVENSTAKTRINLLKTVPANVRFISFEPLISSVGDLDLNDIHWAIVGGESGPHSRPIHIDWVREIREQCIEQSVPFFFKQWGGTQKHKTGRVLDEKIWNQYPEAILGK